MRKPFISRMPWQKFIDTSKNNLWTWRNFASYRILMESDLSQFHAATTPDTETADQETHKHFSGWRMQTEVLTVWPPWSLNLTPLDFYLWTAYENWCEVWKSVCLKWRVIDAGKLVTPYALTPVWQEYWPNMYRETAFIIQNCNYNSKYFEVSLSFCASFMNTVLSSKSI